MPAHADKIQQEESKAIANNFAGSRGKGEVTQLVRDNRVEAIAQRRLQEMANNSLQVKQLKVYQQMADSAVAQQHPVVKSRESDEFIADEMDSGEILPFRAKVRDEVSRRGVPQTLVMLEYKEYGGLQVHIHIAEGTLFGHIKVGEERHSLSPEQSESILNYAEHLLPAIDYDQRSKHSEGKGADVGYRPPGA